MPLDFNNSSGYVISEPRKSALVCPSFRPTQFRAYLPDDPLHASYGSRTLGSCLDCSRTGCAGKLNRCQIFGGGPNYSNGDRVIFEYKILLGSNVCRDAPLPNSRALTRRAIAPSFVLFHFDAVISEYFGNFAHVNRIACSGLTHLVHERFKATWRGDVDIAAGRIGHILETVGDTSG